MYRYYDIYHYRYYHMYVYRHIASFWVSKWQVCHCLRLWDANDYTAKLRCSVGTWLGISGTVWLWINSYRIGSHTCLSVSVNLITTWCMRHKRVYLDGIANHFIALIHNHLLGMNIHLHPWIPAILMWTN